MGGMCACSASDASDELVETGGGGCSAALRGGAGSGKAAESCESVGVLDGVGKPCSTRRELEMVSSCVRSEMSCDGGWCAVGARSARGQHAVGARPACC
eukprot:2529452-Prymnesium_polylepis.1